jgi:hypothetical protein
MLKMKKKEGPSEIRPEAYLLHYRLLKAIFGTDTRRLTSSTIKGHLKEEKLVHNLKKMKVFF